MSAVVRGDPLGPVRLNQLHSNCRIWDELQRIQHFADGQHNALEIPWVLGHVDGTTGYLFDTTFGGGTIANPATGAFTINIASGVLTLPAAAVLANVADSGIESKPHTITWEGVSDTSIKVRIRELSSALGAGNTWADVNRDFDIAVHAPAQAIEASLLAANVEKARRDFLTEAATDWNAIVGNQALAWNAARLEHDADGAHNLNRIAKAVWWGRPSAGPSFTTTLEQGIKTLTYVSTGVVELELDSAAASAAKIACFPEVQPATAGEMCIVNARGFDTTHVRLYTYAYSGGSWARVDRSLFCAIHYEE